MNTTKKGLWGLLLLGGLVLLLAAMAPGAWATPNQSPLRQTIPPPFTIDGFLCNNNDGVPGCQFPPPPRLREGVALAAGVDTPIVNELVTLSNGKTETTYTTADGYYKFEDLAAGSTWVVTALGFSRAVTIIGEEEGVGQDFYPGMPPYPPAQSVAITLNVTLERPNDPAPDPSWAVPVHFSLHPPGDPGTICHEWDLTLDQSGNWTGDLTLSTGVYDARLKNPHTLRNVKANVIIAGPMTIDMGTLLEGDANDDNWVKGDDFSLLRLSFMKQEGQPGFDPGADFDENDIVNILDFSLLATNYTEKGDKAVP